MARRSAPPRRRLRRALAAVGLSRLALLWWAWRNRHDLRGWVRLLRRVPHGVFDPVRRKALLTEARLRAAITADGTARAAGLDVVMYGAEPRVTATRGTLAERNAALATFLASHPTAAADAQSRTSIAAVAAAPTTRVDPPAATVLR